MGEEKKRHKHLFGLVGKDISYSFSRGYFADKFEKEKLEDHSYINFDLSTIQDFPNVARQFKSNLKGVNVTIPYKQEVVAFLDEIDEIAEAIGAVNTIKLTSEGKIKGYNSDAVGFRNSIQPFLQSHHKKALILGTGGASKAVAYVFEELGIEYFKVSRNPQNDQEITYQELTQELMTEYTVIVNCTPLGTFPKVELKPNIPYEFLDSKHLLYDLIYNPKKTAFLMEGETRGVQIKNGLEMLELQAEESWRIWNT